MKSFIQKNILFIFLHKEDTQKVLDGQTVAIQNTQPVCIIHAHTFLEDLYRSVPHTNSMRNPEIAFDPTKNRWNIRISVGDLQKECLGALDTKDIPTNPHEVGRVVVFMPALSRNYGYADEERMLDYFPTRNKRLIPH